MATRIGIVGQLSMKTAQLTNLYPIIFDGLLFSTNIKKNNNNKYISLNTEWWRLLSYFLITRYIVRRVPFIIDITSAK